MANNTWTGGANDGNWGTAGNWSAGTIPADTEDVFINAGAQNITTLPSPIPATGSLASLTISPGWTASLGGGASGSANISATIVSISMGGAAIYLGTGTRTTTNIDSTGRGTVFITAGTNTTVSIGRGAQYDIGGTAVVTTFNDAGGAGTIAYSATVITTATCFGRLTCARPITTAVVGGVVVAQDVTTASGSTTVTTLTIEPGGRWNHRSKGNLATVTLQPGGRLDPQGSVYSFTIGSTNFFHWVGSTLIKTGEGITVTISNETPIGARSVT